MQVTENSNFHSLTDEKCIDEVSSRSFNPNGPSIEVVPTQPVTLMDGLTFAPRNNPTFRDEFTDSPNTTMVEASFFSSLGDLPNKYWGYTGGACAVFLILGVVVGWILRGNKTRSRLQEKTKHNFDRVVEQKFLLKYSVFNLSSLKETVHRIHRNPQILKDQLTPRQL